METLFSGNIGEEIYNTLNFNFLFNLFIETLLTLINKNDSNVEDINIIETTFEFLTGILGFAKNVNELEDKLTGEKQNDFEKIVFYGILSENISIRTIFSRSMIKLTKICNIQKPRKIFIRNIRILLFTVRNLFIKSKGIRVKIKNKLSKPKRVLHEFS